MTLVSWFDEVAKGDHATAGGKGANLGELARGGLPVPPGYVVTAEAYFRSMEVGGVREELRAAFAEALRHAGDPAALSAATARLQELVRAAGVAKDVRDSVLEAYRRLGDGTTRSRSPPSRSTGSACCARSSSSPRRWAASIRAS